MSKTTEISLFDLAGNALQEGWNVSKQIARKTQKFMSKNPYLMPFGALGDVRANEMAAVQYETLSGISFDTRLPWDEPIEQLTSVPTRAVEDKPAEQFEQPPDEELSLEQAQAAELIQAAAKASGFRAAERALPEGAAVQIFDLTPDLSELKQHVPVG